MEKNKKYFAYKLVPIINTDSINKAKMKARYTGIEQKYPTAVVDWKKGKMGKILYTHV